MTKSFAVLFLLAFTPLLPAQAPPTYDFDAATPGTQSPLSPLVAGFTYRSVRPYQMAIPVLVPTSQFQAILPPGFIALPSSAGATTSTLTLNLFLDQRFQPAFPATTTYGPTSAILITATAFNSNKNRNEIVFPLFEASQNVAELNAAFGPGSARVAKVQAELKQKNGMFQWNFEIEDEASHFELEASAESSVNINNRVVSDPVGLPFRVLNGITLNKSFWAASQSDTLAVPVATAKVKVKTPGNRIQFSNGAVDIVGLGANVTFSRNLEFLIKFE